jgi:tetratricopeptide (TPR) repeat protein
MNRLKSILLLVLVNLTVLAFTQTINEAGEKFNEGITQAKEANYTAAIDAYLATIDICGQLGDEGMDLKSKAESQLTTAYYNQAKSLYKEKKYKEAIAGFNKAVTAAETTGDDKIKAKSLTYIAGINTSYGNSYLKKEEFDKALAKYQEALQSKPGYFKAYYGMGLTYKKMGDLDQMKASMDKVIEMGPADDKTVVKAYSVMGTTFMNEGAKALQGGANKKAVDYLNISVEYKADNPKSYYYMGVAYNGLKNWDESITASKKAIELGYEEPSDAHFQIGQALEGKGDATAACGAYKKVTSGSNTAAAKYQIEQVLKCS